MADSTGQHPLQRLGEDDLNMATAFVLVSGSIKDLAGQYGVSYPTMRQRLDRLIDRLRKLAEGAGVDPLNDYLADMLTSGQLAPNVARRIRELHRAAIGPTDPGQPDGEHCDE